MDCLQLPFIRLEEAVSWTQRFLTRKIWPKNEVYLWQTNLKANVCRNSTFQVNRRSRKNRELKNHDDGFVDDDGKWVTVNCASATSKFRRRGVDLFLNFRVSIADLSVYQIVLFHGFLSDFAEITSCVYIKTIILFNLGKYGL